jgi:hypothetical protein
MNEYKQFELAVKRRNGTEKEIPCPICHKRRRKGDLSHGKCAEIAAQQEHERTVKKAIKGKECAFSKEQVKKGAFNSSSKKFMSGKLPNWMYS